MIYGAVAFSNRVGGARLNGLEEIVLCLTDGVFESGTAGKTCGYCRGECAAGAVGVDGSYTRSREFFNLVGLCVVEYVGQAIAVKVSGLQHHRHTAGGFRECYCGVAELVVMVNRLPKKQ